MKKIIYNFGLFILLIFIYLVTNQINEYNAWNRISAFVILLIALIHLLKSFYKTIKSTLTNKLKDILLLFLSTLTFILFIEIIFFFIPKSHFFGNTLASKNWRNYYENPINTYGFHDYQPKRKKNTVLFVGDSFTQGHGIKNVKDRFSNKIQEYDNSYSCINIGKNGLDSKQEFTTMLDFISQSKIKPKTIILQYFGNDIEGIAYTKIKKKSKEPYSNLSKPTKLLIKGSYLINYLYWIYPHEDYKPYLDFLKKAYSNPEIVKEHMADLNNFVDYSAKNKINLKVLIFPFLVDSKLSDDIYENKIKSFFKSKNIETLSVK
jgi:lysophospholipase L1-like esterase